MAGLRVEGATSGNVAEVDAGNNLKVALPQVSDGVAQVGAVRAMYVCDDGTYTGEAELASPEVSLDNRLKVGLDSMLFEYYFSPTSQDTGKFYHGFTTMTMTQSGGFLLTNANSTATNGAGALLMTRPQFPIYAAQCTKFEFVAVLTAAPLANQVGIMGAAYNTAQGSSPTDGVWFQISSGGIIGVAAYNGTTTQTGVLLSLAQVSADVGTSAHYAIHVADHIVEFWYKDKLLGKLNTPAAQGQPLMQTQVPLYIHQYNSGTVSGSPQMQMKIAQVSACMTDVLLNRPYAHFAAAMGNMAYQGQGGATMGSTALYTNSLAPGAGAAMTNTTAALGTGLGGQFAALPTLTANTDGIVCSYQNPIGSVNQAPMNLIITGVRIQSMVTTVLVGGPVQYFYSLAYGHTAVSLATTESASFANGTTKAPRRIALGCETYAAAAAVGTIGNANGISMKFDSPIVVSPGEFIAIVAKNVGTVTSSGVITFLVTFDGHYA